MQILKDEATREQYDYAIAHPEEVHWEFELIVHAWVRVCVCVGVFFLWYLVMIHLTQWHFRVRRNFAPLPRLLRSKCNVTVYLGLDAQQIVFQLHIDAE